MARMVLMGTPAYAQRIFAGILEGSDDVMVVTKPDVPQGRHRRMTPSLVAEWADRQGLMVLKPDKLADIRDTLLQFDPDWLLTAAYGRILPSWLLGVARYGSYNLHASLLPRWRGPNPVAWAIRSGDQTTGVTLMSMDRGIDTGPIVAQKVLAIAPEDTMGTLTMKLADLAVELWREVRQREGVRLFPSWPQPEDGATYAPKFEPDAGRIPWEEPASRVDAHVRSMTPEPGAYTILQGQRVKILQAVPVPAALTADAPGSARLVGNDWIVATGQGALRVLTIQPAGRRPMTPGEFARGQRGDGTWQLI
ncbi:MAG: methionyl-tRNA formyltransferase [Firmicutes bacterium]|nr:methionyl-tRNA formyltransferase [Bacillota bacterium]